MAKKAKEEGKRLKVTVYLIKEGYSKIDDFLDLEGNFERLAVHTADAEGELIYKGGVRSEPDWAELFEDVKGFKRDQIYNLSSRGLYVTKHENRFFCFTFGHARHLIDQLAYERNFGLIVTLNVSDPSSIRSIDKTNISHIALHSKEQATRNLEIGEFEFDHDIDILKSITARIEKKTEEDDSETVSGRDSVSIYTRVDLASFGQVAAQLYTAYSSKRYKNLYPWFEFIQEERDKLVVEALDTALVKKIVDKKFHDVWMAIPEVVEWVDIKGFANKKRRAGPVTRADLDIEAWAQERKIDETLTIEALKQMNVFMYWTDDRPPKSWKVYRCLNAEVDLQGKKYVLNDGVWYHIAKKYVAEVNQFYDSVPNSTRVLPSYGAMKEPEYLKLVAANDNSYALMDRKSIPYGGGRSKVEFCDLLSKDGDIIHVKKYAGSSVLSHLFQQALVSGDSFLHDEEFRNKVNEELPKGFKLKNAKATPSTDEYRICLAIMSDKPGVLELPFFSKVSLKYAVKQLRRLGYEVSKLKINR